MTLAAVAPHIMFLEFAFTMLFLAVGLVVAGYYVRKIVIAYNESRKQVEMRSQAMVEAARARSRARSSTR